MIKKIMKNYKLLILIPLIITIIALLLITFNGIDEGIELKGGSLANIKLNQPVSSPVLEKQLKEKLNVNEVNIISNREKDATIQISSEINSGKFKEALKGTGTVIGYNAIGPVLSEEAMTQVYWAMLFAFLFMAITVFIIFREIVPSIAVIIAAASDIIISVGGMSIFNVSLSIASVGALLMLIGYSVDTDILLTTRVLKRKKGTVEERASEAMKTGLTMSIAAIASMVVLYLVTIFLIPEANTLSDIAAVLIIGLTADILTTWLMNLGFLKWYLEAKN
jgi:preprotein translocase subunit SecF